MPSASTSAVTTASDISLPSSPYPSPPHDLYAFASSDEVDAAPRTWPAADELALLEAMAAHKELHGRLPNRVELAAAVAGTLPHVSAEQAGTRLDLLRQRYDGSVRRLRCVTDEDVRVFRLSKRIWEGAPRPHHERRGFEELQRMYPCLASMVEAIDAESRHPGMMRHAFGMMGDEQAAVLEAKVRKQRVAQMKAEVQRSELRSTVVEAIIGAME